MNTLTKFLLAAGAVALFLWLFFSARQALTPFIFAAIIAYIAAPLAQRIERRFPPAAAAAVVVLLSLLALVMVPLAFIPIIAAQLHELSAFLPTVMQKLNTYVADIPADFFSAEAITENISGDNITSAINVAADWFESGITLLSAFLTILLITPLSAFYFLRDRKVIGGELAELLPPYARDHTMLIARDLDGVLSEFLRGQLIVMAVMGVYYALALKFAGLPAAFTIGIISGALTFIPYLGFILGVTLATIVGIGHFDSFTDIIIIWLLMGIGTIVESMLITPRLVGERVGLHPLAVLLSIMVMGELFGFIGVLAALPIAAILLVLGRHARRRYIGSDFYGHW